MRLIHIKLPFSTHIDEKQSLTATRLYLPKMPTKSACVFFPCVYENRPSFTIFISSSPQVCRIQIEANTPAGYL